MAKEDKRIGILRTFHHKLYDQDAYPSQPKRLRVCFQFYCIKHNCSGLFILVAVALLIVGVLSLVYSYMVPSLYKFLDRDESTVEKIRDKAEYTNYKDLFIITGIILMALAVLSVTFGLMCPFYMTNQQIESEKEECQRTPIMVNYELPPYDKSYRRFYDDSSDESMYSPHETEKFQPILVQNNNS